MLVANYENIDINGVLISKAKNGFSYLMIGKQEIEGVKHIYLVKKEGKRSWGGFALTNIDDEFCHIKGNSTTIMENVYSRLYFNLDIYIISNNDKTTLRKAIMEVITYGTVNVHDFNIEKA